MLYIHKFIVMHYNEIQFKLNVSTKQCPKCFSQIVAYVWPYEIECKTRVHSTHGSSATVYGICNIKNKLIMSMFWHKLK